MIIVITGLMASGKSTVAQLLAQRFSLGVHLRGDAFRRMIVSGRADMADPPSEEALRQLQLRYALAAQAAKSYAEAGFDVIVQDNYYGASLPAFVQMLLPHNAQVFVLNPDVDTIARREAARPKRGYGGYAVAPLHAAFLAETPRIGHWIDNSAQTPQETVDAIWGVLAPSP